MESEGERMSEEIEVQVGQEVMNSEEGMRYLESTLLMVPWVSYTATELVGMLFQVLMLPKIKNSWVNSNGVRAVTYILADLDLDLKVKEMENVVVDKFKVMLNELQANVTWVVDMAKEQVKEVVAALRTQIGDTIQGLGEEIQKVAK